MTLSSMTRKSTVCRLVRGGLVDRDRLALAERPQEADLRARPRGLVAAILVRQQVDVVAVGRGGLFVAAHALEDRADGVMHLVVARRQLERRLRLVQRFVELVLRRQRARQAVVAARQIRRQRQRVAELLVRLVEQARRPQRVGVHREHFGVARRLLLQRGGFALRLDELAEPQRRLDHADARLDGDGLESALDRLAKGLERLAVAGLFEQQRAELELQTGVVDVVRPCTPATSAAHDDRGHQRQARSSHIDPLHQAPERNRCRRTPRPDRRIPAERSPGGSLPTSRF